MPRAAAPPLPLTECEREELLQVSKFRSTPQSVALRIQIVLRAAEGIANKVLARQLSTTLPTVLLWRERYQHEGLAGILEDRLRSRRPKQISAKPRSRDCGDHPAQYSQRRDLLECQMWAGRLLEEGVLSRRGLVAYQLTPGLLAHHK